MVARETPDLLEATRETKTPAEPEPAGVAPQRPTANQRPSRMLIPAITFATWMLALVGLTLTSANPITLNRLQILDADLIVEATLVDPRSGEFRIHDSWPKTVVEQTVTVPEAMQASAEKGRSYLLPLNVVDDGSFEVAPAPPPIDRPLIYPATTESRKQLIAILGR